MKQKLLVLSVDSLFYDDLDWLRKLPNFRMVLERGSYVKGMRSVYPAMTYVAHASMMTGVYPEHHGIAHNEQIMPTEKFPLWNWYRSDLKAKTVVDVLKEAGYTTSTVAWPVMGADPNTDYTMAEIWSDRVDGNPTERFRSVCSDILMDTLYDKYKDQLRWKSQPYLDKFAIDCSEEIILKYQPDAMFVHISFLDHARHKYGGFCDEADQALLACDERFGRLIRALKIANVYDITNFVVVGDHGHLPVEKVVHFNTLLSKEGLIEISADGSITDYKCYCHSAGLSAHIVLKDPENHAVREQVELLLGKLAKDSQWGIKRVSTGIEILAEEHLGCGIDFVLDGMPGVTFGNNCTGPTIMAVDNSDYKLSVSGHGHRPDIGPQPFLMAAGPRIRQGIVLERQNLLDLAPTCAKIMGQTMTGIQGRILHEIIV